MQEIWKDVEDYEGLYQVSNLGRIKSLERKVNKWDGERTLKSQILKQRINNSGYYRVCLYKNRNPKSYYTHRLIAISFLLNKYNKPCVNHKNGFKLDNRILNLEWCTRSENSKHAFKNGLLKCYLPNMNGITGYNHPSSKAILQFDLNGCFIKEYANAIELNKELGYSTTYISGACNGSVDKAYGFKWEFKTAPSKAIK